MLTVVKTQGATVANAALPLLVQTTATPAGLNPGLLRDAFYAAYQIFTVDGTQVYPTPAGTRTLVDLTADKIETGVYAAKWVSSAAALGAYYIQWFVVPSDGDAEITFTQDFEVASVASRGLPIYASIQSMRDEGVTVAQKSDAAVLRLIQSASRYVDLYTGRTFMAQKKTLRVDGNNSRCLMLEEPIVAISGLNVSLVSQFTSSDLQVLDGTFRIYNRNLTIGLINPDDRDNPRLEFVHDDDLQGVNYRVPSSGYRLTQLIWPKGQQNVRIDGWFGFVENDGSFMGKTPELIQLATKLLCFRYIDKMGSDGRDDATKRARLMGERTKDQSYTLSKATLFTGYSGDSEIDGILRGFARPPRMGAA